MAARAARGAWVLPPAQKASRSCCFHKRDAALRASKSTRCKSHWYCGFHGVTLRVCTMRPS
eukprot:scaffold6242_cov12-Tisochrysis_lutea.AAC.1